MSFFGLSEWVYGVPMSVCEVSEVIRDAVERVLISSEWVYGLAMWLQELPKWAGGLPGTFCDSEGGNGTVRVEPWGGRDAEDETGFVCCGG